MSFGYMMRKNKPLCGDASRSPSCQRRGLDGDGGRSGEHCDRQHAVKGARAGREGTVIARTPSRRRQRKRRAPRPPGRRQEDEDVNTEHRHRPRRQVRKTMAWAANTATARRRRRKGRTPRPRQRRPGQSSFGPLASKISRLLCCPGRRPRGTSQFLVNCVPPSASWRPVLPGISLRA